MVAHCSSFVPAWCWTLGSCSVRSDDQPGRCSRQAFRFGRSVPKYGLQMVNVFLATANASLRTLANLRGLTG